MKPNEFNSYKKLYSKTQSNMKSGDFSHFKRFFEDTKGRSWDSKEKPKRRANKGSERDRGRRD